jgi:hypothetical protein
LGGSGTRLVQIYLKRAEKVAFVRGDADVDFEYVADVIDVAHQAGVQRIGSLTKGQECWRVVHAAEVQSQPYTAVTCETRPPGPKSTLKETCCGVALI